MLRLILYLLVISLFSECTNLSKRNRDSLSAASPKNDWTRDKCGCAGLRDESLAAKLIGDNGLENAPKESFLIVFGEPDTIKKVRDDEVLVYYFNSICENNKPLPGSDKCYANFYFRKGILALNDFVCE